jgi:hypothetical protein
MNDAAVSKITGRHLDGETPRQTAVRLRAKRSISLGEAAHAPLAKEVFDDMWDKS